MSVLLAGASLSATLFQTKDIPPPPPIIQETVNTYYLGFADRIVPNSFIIKNGVFPVIGSENGGVVSYLSGPPLKSIAHGFDTSS